MLALISAGRNWATNAAAAISVTRLGHSLPRQLETKLKRAWPAREPPRPALSPDDRWGVGGPGVQTIPSVGFGLPMQTAGGEKP